MRKVLPRHPVPQRCDADVPLQKERSERFDSFIELFFIKLTIVIFDASHAILETANPFAQSFHQFGNFFATEKEKDDQYDKQDFLCPYSKHHYQYIEGTTYFNVLMSIT